MHVIRSAEHVEEMRPDVPQIGRSRDERLCGGTLREERHARNCVAPGPEIFQVSMIARDDDELVGSRPGEDCLEKSLGTRDLVSSERHVLRVAGLVGQKKLEVRKIELSRSRQHRVRRLSWTS